MSVTPRNTDALPKWARDQFERLRQEILHLQGEIDHWKNKAHEATSPPGDNATDTYINDGVKLRGLPSGTGVRFIIGPTPSRDYVDVVARHADGAGWVDKDRVEINCGDNVRICPRASNAIHLLLEK